MGHLFKKLQVLKAGMKWQQNLVWKIKSLPWMQIIIALFYSWKKNFLRDIRNSINLCVYGNQPYLKQLNTCD